MRICVLILVFWAVAANLFAQRRQQEYFTLHNPGEGAVSVSLRSRHPETPFADQGWTPHVQIAKGETKAIPLRGFQPFDIAIQYQGNQVLVAERVNLCSMMETCRRFGPRPYAVMFSRGEFGEDGRLRYLTDAGIRLLMSANDDSATMQFVKHDPPRKPRVPPRPPRQEDRQ